MSLKPKLTIAFYVNEDIEGKNNTFINAYHNCDGVELLAIALNEKCKNAALEHAEGLRFAEVMASSKSEFFEQALALAKGRYITFVYAQDALASVSFDNFCRFLSEEGDSYDAVFGFWMFGKKGYLFDRLIDERKVVCGFDKMKSLPKVLGGVILKTETARAYRADVVIDDDSADAFLLSQVLQDEAKMASASDIIYSRQPGAGADMMDVCQNQFLSLIAKSGGPLTKAQQRYVLIELCKCFNHINSNESVNDETFANKDEIKQQLHRLMSLVELETVAELESVSSTCKSFMLNSKLSVMEDVELVPTKKGLCLDGRLVFPFKSKVSLPILEIRNGKLILEGLDFLGLMGDEWSLELKTNKGAVIKPNYSRWALKDSRSLDGTCWYKARKFLFEIPLNENLKTLEFRANNGEKSWRVTPGFGEFAKITRAKKAPMYYRRDGFIIKWSAGHLSVCLDRFKTRTACRWRMHRFMMENGMADLERLRIRANIMRKFKKKPLWIIRDNEDRAKDSGAEMFKYVSQSEWKDYADLVFVLGKDSEDYPELSKYGKIVQPESDEYMLAHMLADKVIDTRGGINPTYVFGERGRFMRDMCDWDYVWLIHGIITRNESTWTHRFYSGTKLYATCNERERASILDPENGYGYKPRAVKLTGLPRHDALQLGVKEKKILFMPTWRQHLAGDVRPGSSERSYVPDFKANEFYTFYNGLINDRRLIEAMKKHGFTGDFYLHPCFMKQAGDFQENEVIKVGKSAADANALINACSIFLTDYSSAQFEGAYLQTPLIYTQYDKDEFSQLHTGKEGYFDYERDGFGPICQTIEETVDAVIEAMESGCVMQEPYASRADNFFKHKDQNNSERVLKEILKIDGVKMPDEDSKDDSQLHVEKRKNSVVLYEGNRIHSVATLEDAAGRYAVTAQCRNTLDSYKFEGSTLTMDISVEKNAPAPGVSESFGLLVGEQEFDVELVESRVEGGRLYAKIRAFFDFEETVFTVKSSPVRVLMRNSECNYAVNITFDKGRQLEWRPEDRACIYSTPCVLKDGSTSVFLRQTYANNTYIVMRDFSPTDLPEEQEKINRAWEESQQAGCKYSSCIMMYEKFAVKYEESASVLFERLIDEGYRNVFFVMDTKSQYYKNVPEKCRPFIIQKYSYDHYLLFFSARLFIATESIPHSVELNLANSHVLQRITSQQFDYVFLQHGVMYMFSLEGRSYFSRGGGVSKEAKTVVSSHAEALHFIEKGGYREEDLIMCGLPKYDRAVRYENADKILIMPTSRDFEYNIMRNTPEESTYYKFSKAIVEAVPQGLRDKIVFVSHPLIKEQMRATDLAQYMPDEFVYDELLRQTRLLITDCSSISYDAFYRGANVVFCWEDLQMCLDAMGYKLMLNDENVFADVSRSFSDLPSLIEANYCGPQTEEHVEKYRQIVEFHDGENTTRCFQYLKDNDFLDESERIDISTLRMKNLGRKVYTGVPVFHNNAEIRCENRYLVYGKDFNLEYSGNDVPGGFGKVTIKGKGRYFGEVTKKFRVCKPIKDCEFLVLPDAKYGDNIDSECILVKDGDRVLEFGVDYVLDEVRSLEYDDIVSFAVKGRGVYGGKKTLYAE